MQIELSIVTTLYNSATSIQAFLSRMESAASALYDSVEFIIVNDGSLDNSLEITSNFLSSQNNITIIDLSRNFGHHKAMMVGLKQARGENVFLIDSDLEEPPEVIKDFKSALQSKPDLDMIYGVQKKRKGGVVERASGALFYRLVNALVDTPIPQNYMTVRLMSRRFVNELTKYTEQELNFSTLISLCGFQSKAITIDKGFKGVTTYTWAKKFTILINTITSSSAKPLWWIFLLGLGITLFSMIAIIYIFSRYFINGVSVPGWSSLISSVWFIGGMIMMSIGTIGIYLSKIFIEVKRRPYVNIKQVISNKERFDDR